MGLVSVSEARFGFPAGLTGPDLVAPAQYTKRCGRPRLCPPHGVFSAGRARIAGRRWRRFEALFHCLHAILQVLQAARVCLQLFPERQAIEEGGYV